MILKPNKIQPDSQPHSSPIRALINLYFTKINLCFLHNLRRLPVSVTYCQTT